MEPLEKSGLAFVDILQFGLEHPHADGLLLQQLAVVDRIARCWLRVGGKPCSPAPSFRESVKTRRGAVPPGGEQAGVAPVGSAVAGSARSASRTIAAATATMSSRGTRSVL